GEVDSQLVTAWLLYNIWEVEFDTRNRMDLRGKDATSRGLKDQSELEIRKRLVGLKVAEKALRVGFFAYSRALGLTRYSLPNMHDVAKIAREYYNNDLRGGEGHMEVGKLILNAVGKKSTMTLSVKPFGCMPSSGVSDGVQSLVQERFPGSLFCAVETSGEGAVNFQSRVQMFLHKAKCAARDEVDRALSRHGVTLEEVRRYLDLHPSLNRALYRAEHSGTSTAVDVITEVASRLRPQPTSISEGAEKLSMAAE
ncbi:MAG TPA: 2-hydroxyglutaryl-CoA dehydratase, partial [Polyangiaceae bacterium]|nr:2-hydroxyglutaryl-CoA dehydratase [Polyangiaceae bacterium]